MKAFRLQKDMPKKVHVKEPAASLVWRSQSNHSLKVPQCGQIPFERIFAPQAPQAYG